MKPRNPLFVPADSERKVTKAYASEADAVILDLEDSIAPSAEPAARSAAAARLASDTCCGLHVWTTSGVQGVLLHDLTRGATAVMCPASHEGWPRQAISWRNSPKSQCRGNGIIIVQGRALIHAGPSLQTSHPAGLRPHHCPASGTGELQEGGTTL